MGFYDAYKAIFDQFKTVLGTISSLNSVVVGRVSRPKTLPVAYVYPLESEIEQANIGETLLNRLNVEVMVVIRETEPEDWFTDIVPIMGEVVDVVLADRSLAGSAKDVVPTLFSPVEITLMERLYYGGVIRFQVQYFYTP